MPRRAFTQGRSARGTRRPGLTNWARTTFRNTVVAAGTKVLVASFVLSNAGINEVVRRTRGRFLFTSDQGTIFEGSVAAFGFVVVNDLALAAGVASMPGPITDANDDGWFVWESMPMLQGNTDGSSSASVGVGGANYGAEFDSKAMRRVEEGFGIAVVAEVASVAVELTMGISLLTSRS